MLNPQCHATPLGEVGGVARHSSITLGRRPAQHVLVASGAVLGDHDRFPVPPWVVTCACGRRYESNEAGPSPVLHRKV